MAYRLTIAQAIKEGVLTREKAKELFLRPKAPKIKGSTGARHPSPPERVVALWVEEMFPGEFVHNHVPWLPTSKMEIDFACVRLQLGIEVDGLRDHRSHKGFARDREKDLLSRETGWVLLRFTTKQIMQSPQRCQDIIKSTYALCSSRNDAETTE